MNYVIIGNSAAGIPAAEAIRKNDKKGKVTIISNEPFKTYSRPLISYYLKGKVSDDRMRFRNEDFYEKNNIEAILGKEAVKVDPKRKKVELEDGTKLPYDKLLLATGSVPFVPFIENAQDKGNVYTFLKWQDAIDLKKAAKKESRVVVIGGGLIGLKAAEGLAKLCDDVTVVELADRVLATILDKEAGAMVSENIENHGIKVILNDTAVKAVGEKNVTALELKSGKKLECDILVIAVGVRPAADLAKSCGAEVGRGVLVDEAMQTTVPDIYAAGDVVEGYEVLSGQNKILALWPSAVEQGKTAGDRMSGGNRVYSGGFALNAIDFFGQRIMTSGIINPSEDEGFEILLDKNENSYKKLVIKDDRLYGYILINCPEKAGMYTDLIRRGTPLSELSGNILEDIGLLNFSPAARKEKIYGGGKA
jgi:NAD(P)H-nitrite reductase large subunit